MAQLTKLKFLSEDARDSIAKADDFKALEELRIKYLGRKGIIQDCYKELAELAEGERPAFGKKINALRTLITEELSAKKAQIDQKTSEQKRSSHIFDTTLPGHHYNRGTLHPISQIIDAVCDIFLRLGFKIVEGPEIETEYHNFEALNIPLDHPSRDGFDTFYVDAKNLLRSQTSTVQIRAMENTSPPLQIIAPGKVFRPDAVDASHSFMFHQIEGLMVDERVTFADLKGVLYAFCRELFGRDIKMRFRPHFFPFTEPSVEVDIAWKKGWLEILGAGMVNPRVFQSVGINPKKFRGFAFGLGIERIAMIKYGINDIRIFCENDLKFLKQFA